MKQSPLVVKSRLLRPAAHFAFEQFSMSVSDATTVARGRPIIPVYCHVRLGSCVGANPPFDAHAVYLELGAAGCFVQRYCLVLVLGKKYFLLQILLFVMRALYL